MPRISNTPQELYDMWLKEQGFEPIPEGLRPPGSLTGGDWTLGQRTGGVIRTPGHRTGGVIRTPGQRTGGVFRTPGHRTGGVIRTPGSLTGGNRTRGNWLAEPCPPGSPTRGARTAPTGGKRKCVCKKPKPKPRKRRSTGRGCRCGCRK